MNAIKNNTVVFQKTSFLPAKNNTNQAIRQNVPVFAAKNPLPLTPAMYFHPSFGINTPLEKEFNQLLNSALQNPKKVSEQILKKLEKIARTLVETKDANDHINEGRDSIVMRLTDEYVAKIPRGNSLLPNERFWLMENPLNKQLKTWYGGTVAKLGDIEILKNADPKRIAQPIGAPYKSPDFEFVKTYYKEKCVPKLVAMPQEAFDEIAMDFKILNDMKTLDSYSYMFDTMNPNNFLLVGDKIKITDDIDEVSSKNPNDLSEMLSVFLLKNHYSGHCEPDNSLVEARKNILKKCVLASEKAELPINYTDYSARDINKAAALIGKPSQGKAIADNLKFFRNTIPDMTKRLNSVEEYLDKLFK